MAFSIATQRLILRPWRDNDCAAFAAMGADAEVMRYFERLQTPADAAAGAARMMRSYAADGFCFWALELPGEAAFIGFAGIARVAFAAPFTPAVEIGWRLARRYWGQGLATEAARAALADGFGRCGLGEIVAMAVPDNAASLGVMRKIGMARDPDGDFDHPNVTPGHRLRRHVLYRITQVGVTAPGRSAPLPAPR